MPAPDYAVEIGQLEAALASGELTVESDGERVTYQNFGDLKARLNYFKGLVASAAPSAIIARPSSTCAIYSVN